MFPALLLVLLTLAAPGRAAESPSPRLRHRLFVGPEEVRALDSRTLAELLVERVRRECDLAGAPTSGEKVLGDDFTLIEMVPARALASIARFGFLNQHQTGRSGGFARERDRFEAEQELAMLRLPFSADGRALLPKYAVLDVRNEGMGTFPLPTRYGDVAIVFKDEVAARATWTYADSLDYSRKAGRFSKGGAANPVLAHTFRYGRKKEDRNRCGNYCEAQIWGDLSLADAAYAMVLDSEPIPDALAGAGLPVYGYAVPASSSAIVDPGRTAQYVRGSLRAGAGPGREAEAAAPPEYFLAARAASRLSDEDLIVAEASASSVEDGPGAFSPRQRLLGELAARPKGPAVVRALQEAFSSGDAQARALALYGLSELPWEAFKPILLAALDGKSGPALISAVAFSAEHRDDAQVSARLDALRRAPESEVSEWVARLDSTRLCDPR